MKILGIDPGTATVGLGIIQTNGRQLYSLIYSGLVETDKDLEHGRRLDLIYKGIADTLAQHKPDVVAIERLFFATNVLTAIGVSQATGVIKLAVFHAGLPMYDYTPMQVKLVVGGSGRADKQLMKQTVKRLFKLREKRGMRTHFDNTADALAIAICHAKKVGV